MHKISNEWIETVIDIAIESGEKILTVYESDFEVDRKQDGSVVTLADHRAHDCIIKGLKKLSPKLKVVSEESKKIAQVADNEPLYWLVDPLDGTKEFVKRNGEFTVNIALIENNKPIWGVVYAPVTNISYFGGVGLGATKISNDSMRSKIKAKKNESGQLMVITSRSHLSQRTLDLFDYLKNQGYQLNTIASGSSLKFCMIAEGLGDIYPRLGLTSEWDTAAAQAVLTAAQGEVVRFKDSKALIYNKDDILNPEFFACGKISRKLKALLNDWHKSTS